MGYVAIIWRRVKVMVQVLEGVRMTGVTISGVDGVRRNHSAQGHQTEALMIFWRHQREENKQHQATMHLVWSSAAVSSVPMARPVA